ncbi:hypothetical protein V7S43_000797 [Phytophthora oleae]|uniref:GDP-D-glucose phosphorylase 1 n=1 Tax=Phytophthora oleae TaxID=2107226 RepID=A0ABD3G857_9STRA
MSLDELLLRQWGRAASDGVMRTNVEDTVRRRLPGDLGLIVQFNPSHFKSKRPVDKQLLAPSSTSPSKPKDSSFNFTKANRENHRLPSVQAAETEASDEAQHFVLVNVAPLVPGHVLFVLDLNLVKPQKMTETFMRYGLSISNEIQHEDFALGFNSAGAWSSVNHFHLQGYFFPPVEGAVTGNFPVASQLREEIFRVNGAVVKSLPNWKTTCYVVEPMDAVENGEDVVKVAWTLLELLQRLDIPHNLVIVGSVVFIFPRQLQRENGVGLFTDSSAAEHTGRLRIAVAELSGLVIAGDRIAYDQLTEEIFNLVLQKEVSLSSGEETAIVMEWKEKLAAVA